MTPPALRVQGSSPWAARLAPLVEAAQRCVQRNIVPGRGPHEPERYLRAGGGYPDPWTRDAAINAWQAGAWLWPQISRTTLDMALEPDGSRVVWDTQWWDQIVWVIGGYELAVTSGDTEWAEHTYRVGAATLARLDERCLDQTSCLYRGPAVMADGITGYPPELHDPARAGDSFVLDHAATHRIACLSTNALYVWALRRLADLAGWLGDDPAPWRARADALAQRVRECFTLSDGRLAYLARVGDGSVPNIRHIRRDSAGRSWCWPTSCPPIMLAPSSPPSSMRRTACPPSGHRSTVSTTTDSDGTARPCGR